MQRILYAYCIASILQVACLESKGQTQFNHQIISKTDNYINTLSPHSVVELNSNSGYIIGGTMAEFTDKAFIVKADHEGMFMWGKSIFLNENEQVTHAKTLKVENGLISLFNVANYDNFPASFKVLIIKFSEDGEVIWSKSYQTIQYVVASDIAQTSSGFILAGTINNDYGNSHNSLFISSVDSDGNIVWSRMLQNEYEFTARTILTNDDGSFYIGAQVGKFEEDGISRYALLHVNEDGTVRWTKTYRNSAINGLFTCDPSRLLKTSSGDLIFSGNQNLAGGDMFNPELLKLSSDGTLLKHIWIQGASAANMNATISNDEIFLLGNALLTASEPTTPGAELSQIVDGNVVMKFDLDLNPVWSKRLGVQPQEFREACAIIPASNGEILTVFGTHSGNYQMPYLDIRRMDPNSGNSNSCERLEYSKDRFISVDPIVEGTIDLNNEIVTLTAEVLDAASINFSALLFENKTYCIESNVAPTITKDLPNISVNAAHEFVIDLSEVFVDPDQDDKMVFYAAEGENWFSGYLPEWITLDTTAMTLTGFPNPGDLGTYKFYIVAIDFAGHQSIEQFTLTVELANRSPYSLQTISDKVIRSGKEFKYIFPVTLFDDPDQNELTYSLTLEDGTSLPDWLTFSPETRTVLGYPNDDLIGTQHTLRYIASDGDLTASLTFTINVEANQAPTAISLTIPADATLFSEDIQEIRFAWTPSTDPDGDRIVYNLQISDDSDLIATYELTATEITLPTRDLPLDKQLSWFVRATDGGMAADTDLRTFSIRQVVTGIEHPSVSTGILYPNPAESTVHISLDMSPDATVTLVNLQGTIVLKQNLDGRNELNVANLSAGLYNVRISTAGKIISTKLFIRR